MDSAMNSAIQAVMEKVREMVDANTIIGEPIVTPAGVTIVPISKISVGFGLGGSTEPKTDLGNRISGGGAGAGIIITPVAFLSIVGENVRMITVDKDESTVDKALAMLPDLIDKAIFAFKGEHGEVEYV